MADGLGGRDRRRLALSLDGSTTEDAEEDHDDQKEQRDAQPLDHDPISCGAPGTSPNRAARHAKKMITPTTKMAARMFF